MTARVRPITVMLAVAAVVLVLGGAFALRNDDDATIVGQPDLLPIPIVARAESAMAPVTTTVGSVLYVRDPNLVDPGETSSAWSVAAVDPDPSALRRLADAFGVIGDLRTMEDGWQIGADGEANVRVKSSSGSGWRYSPGGAPMVAMSCLEPAMTDATVSGDGCSLDLPGVPSATEAASKAHDLVQAAGLDVADMRVEATSGDWGAQATVTPELGGVPTQSFETTIMFGADATITGASGWLGVPVVGDRYPLIGLDAAVGRLNDGRDVLDGLDPLSWYASGAMNATTIPPETTTVPPETTIPADQPDACDACPSPCDPAACVDPYPGPTVVPEYAGLPDPPASDLPASEPAEPQPVPSTTKVVVTSVDLVLAAVVGSDGAIWLVPAYRLTGDDGVAHTILAIDESFVAASPLQPEMPDGPAVSGVIAPTCTAPWMC